jgi:hypothetical protein
MKLAYCDYIAFVIHDSLVRHSTSAYSEQIIDVISSVRYNLGAFGELKDTKKFIFITDKNGTRYQITVEEV